MKTKRVRIAVAIGPDGEWTSWGFSGDKSGRIDDEELIDYALDTMSSEVANVHFVEAYIPLPDSATIEGEVKS